MRSPNIERNLDALAACIVGVSEIRRLAKKWDKTEDAVRKAAVEALKRLTPETPADDVRALRLVPVVGKVA